MSVASSFSSLESEMFEKARKPHPLLIPAVIQEALKNLSYSDLKNLRLVSTAWDEEASKLLRNCTQIRFTSESQIERYIKKFNENYSCNSYEFGAAVFLKSLGAYEFFKKFGQNVISLKIHNVEWSCSELWELLSVTLPNLKELSIRIFIPKYGHFFPDLETLDDKILPVLSVLKLNFAIDHPDEYFLNSAFLRELFVSVPNLEQLCCPSFPTIMLPSTNACSLVMDVIFSDENIRFPKLKYLCVNANLDCNEKLYCLMRKQFPLEELRLELKPDVTSDALYWLLKSLDSTLTILTITFPFGYNSGAFVEFPVLRKLKYLSLHCYEGSVCDFTQYFPNLKTLLLNDVNLTDNPYKDNNIITVQQEMNERGTPEDSRHAHPLTELCVDEGRMFGPVGQTKKLAILFPKLKKIKLQNANDEILRVIFSGFPYLEELILEGRFTDSGVTGIPFEACPEISEFDNSFLKLHGNRLRMYPYLGSLTELRRIELNSDYLTNMSVLLGVNHCQNLKYQRVISSKIPSSEKALKRYQFGWIA